MNRVSVFLPDDMYQQLTALAKMEGVSVPQYVVYAIARQLEQAATNEAPPASNTQDIPPSASQHPSRRDTKALKNAETQPIFGIDTL